ncbi:Bystin-domain-containing protein [Coniophora puteana RWD-64-598 SS2]|uniref:Bystin-domain-containing protein n=1 Tax=Coniophora puteana (strain RWD-64-598) TaxID=741705 RepID=A0A5M3MV36_CONPW|nr:Bystin-domain-containing protein [Coniophora puteana RWD-64-598 SS2]EIW82461.1 Bystin-domain-containing protein [Coniophora puteana RWD-64-598 SS2]
MPRAQKAQKPKHDPLLAQIYDDETYAKYGRVSRPGKRKKSRTTVDDGDEPSEAVLDSKSSQRVFELARDQQAELDMPEDEEDLPSNAGFQLREDILEENEDDISEDEPQNADEDAEEMFDIDAGDMETLDKLLPSSSGERKTLADVIFSKLEEASVGGGGVTSIQKVQQDSKYPDPAMGLDPRVVEAYSKVATILRVHKSGPLPKAFKIIPTLPAWARILALTQPENWSPHACRAATRIFISTMKPPQAQLFLQVVLLDAIREDIKENKKLNVHYYESLMRALYKPSAFFKGIVFPLLDSGCTLKEAAIVASVVAKKKVPMLHSAAALLRIAEMDYTGPNSLFIRVLVDKKYQLPYKVVDALVFHFIRLSNTYKARARGDTEKLPVLWHQSLLAFCQRYSADLTPDQKDALLDVVRANPHPQIGLEVRRELLSSVARGAPVQDAQDVEMS